jgi:hypothetical protein
MSRRFKQRFDVPVTADHPDDIDALLRRVTGDGVAADDGTAQARNQFLALASGSGMLAELQASLQESAHEPVGGCRIILGDIEPDLPDIDLLAWSVSR